MLGSGTSVQPASTGSKSVPVIIGVDGVEGGSQHPGSGSERRGQADGVGEVRSEQDLIAQVRFGQVREAQILAGQVRVGQLHAGKVRVKKPRAGG